MAPENRQTVRVPVTQVKVSISSSERLRASYLKDLSEGGLFIRAEKPLPVGRRIVVDLLPPGWAAPLRLNGVVARVQETPVAGMGVRFDDNPPAAVAQLKALVAEYSTKGEPTAAPPESEAQLQQLLSSYADLQNALQQRTAELDAERAKRTQAQERLTELAGALAERSGAASASETLKVELEVALRELNETRTNLLERDGELEAYKKEVAQLEADEGTSRRLATKVAREKAELQAELTQLRAGRSDSDAAVKRLTSEQQVLRAEAKALELQHKSVLADVERLRAENVELGARLAESDQRLTAADQRHAEVQANFTRAESEVILLKGELSAKERRLATVEGSLKEMTDRAAQLKVKERELRELLSMVGQAPGAQPPLALAQAVIGEPGPGPEFQDPLLAPPTRHTSIIFSTVELETPSEVTTRIELEGPPLETQAAPTPTPMPTPIPTPEQAVAAPGLFGVQESLAAAVDAAVPEPWQELGQAYAFPPPSSASSKSGVDIVVDVTGPAVSDSFAGIDVDVTEELAAPAPIPVRGREELEQRLRQNEGLAKTATFEASPAADDETKRVRGLLEAGTRLSDLMVLGRGSISPADLVRVLVAMLQQGALRFQADPPRV